MLNVKYLYDVFFAEYAIKNNCQKRNAQWTPRQAGMSILKNADNSRSYELVYVIAYRLLLLVVFFCSFFCRTISSEKVFVLMDLRLSSYNKSKLQAFRVGPFIPFGSASPSIYRALSRRRRIRIFFTSVYYYSKARNELKKSCVKHDVIFSDFNKKIGFSFARYLDVNLVYSALGSLEHAETAGHFDVYTALISVSREEGRIAKAVFYQHGLYEQFDFKGSTWGFYSDHVVLRYSESEQYFFRCLNKNVKVAISIAAPKFMPVCHIEGEGKRLKVAYALQNDCYAQDFANIQGAISMVPNAYWLLYLHPATPKNIVEDVRLKFPTAAVFTRDRHDNIDYVISRYSSLVLDYTRLGVKGIFISSTDKVCVFESVEKKFDVVYNLEQLRDIL